MTKIINDLDILNNDIPLPICRVDTNRILIKNGTDNYISSDDDFFFKCMRFSTSVKKSKNQVKVVDISNTNGSVSSIILPKDDDIIVTLIADNVTYKYRLKCRENQRCCIGYKLSDKTNVDKIDLEFKKNFPSEISCVEITSVSKAKQSSLPILKFKKNFKVFIQKKKKSKNKSMIGINYELASDYS